MRLQVHLHMYSQQIQSNLSGLTGPIGVRVSLNVDRVHLEHVLEFAMEETNFALAKKNKLNPVRTFHRAMLTNMNVSQIAKDRVQPLNFNGLDARDSGSSPIFSCDIRVTLIRNEMATNYSPISIKRWYSIRSI